MEPSYTLKNKGTKLYIYLVAGMIPLNHLLALVCYFLPGKDACEVVLTSFQSKAFKCVP